MELKHLGQVLIFLNCWSDAKTHKHYSGKTSQLMLLIVDYDIGYHPICDLWRSLPKTTIAKIHLYLSTQKCLSLLLPSSSDYLLLKLSWYMLTRMNTLVKYCLSIKGSRKKGYLNLSFIMLSKRDLANYLLFHQSYTKKTLMNHKINRKRKQYL